MQATKKRRGLHVILALVVATSLSFLSTYWCAHAKADDYRRFGTYLDTRIKYGGTTSINTPAAIPVAGDELILYRNVVQTNPISALVQGGLVRTGNSQAFSTCGTGSATTWYKFIEYWKISANPTVICQYFGTADPGQRIKIDVFNAVASTPPSQPDASWIIQFDDTTAGGAFKLNYDTGYPGIGGELISHDATFSTTTGAQYQSTTPWNLYGTVNEGSATAAAPGTPSVPGTTDGFWHLMPDTNWYMPAIISPPQAFKVEHNA